MRESNPDLTYIDYLLQQQFNVMADSMVSQLNEAKDTYALTNVNSNLTINERAALFQGSVEELQESIHNQFDSFEDDILNADLFSLPDLEYEDCGEDCH